jgi:hypothetical protein
METRKDHYGLRTFFEHWNFAFIAITAILTSQGLDYFTHLCGTPWIRVFVASFALMILGGALIGCAKFPVYRTGRFFTFGVKSVPAHLHGFYRWGWRLFLFGVLLSLGLFLSRP